MKGLIIKREFIEKILNGSKIWEIRRRSTKYRGKIALIARKKVLGVADLVDSFELPVAELLKYEQYHRAGKFLRDYSRGRNTLFVWVLKNPKRLKRPVEIEIPRGVRIWVKLTKDQVERILKSLEKS